MTSIIPRTGYKACDMRHKKRLCSYPVIYSKVGESDLFIVSRLRLNSIGCYHPTLINGDSTVYIGDKWYNYRKEAEEMFEDFLLKIRRLRERWDLEKSQKTLESNIEN